MRKMALIVAVALGLGIMFTEKATAGLITTGFTGIVDEVYDDGTNIWGLDVGSTFYGSVTYDDSVLLGIGFEDVYLGFGTGNSLTLILGGIPYDETDDVGYFDVEAFPWLVLTDGEATGIDYIFTWDDGQDGGSFYFESDGFWYAENSSFELVAEGTYGFQAEPVPEPSTIALLSVGIVGLLGGAARKKYKRKKL